MRKTLLWMLAVVCYGASQVAAQITDVPSTAPVGAWLFEVDLLTVATDRHTLDRDGVTYRSTSAGSAFVSTGLTARWDLQFGVELWRKEAAVGGGSQYRAQGAGDTWLRTKWNFLGDEADGPAWAVLPYVKLATGSAEISNGRHEPGVLIVHGRPWGENTTWHINAGVDWLAAADGGRDPTVNLSTVLTWAGGDTWSFYGEFYSWAETARFSEWSGEVGVGITCAVGEAGWIDLACYVGLTRAAPDYTPALRCGWQF